MYATVFEIVTAYGEDDNDDDGKRNTVEKHCKNVKKIEGAIRNDGEQEQDVKTVNRERALHIAVPSTVHILKERETSVSNAVERVNERASEQMKKHRME